MTEDVRLLDWSGPDRALSEHLDLWRLARGAVGNPGHSYHQWWIRFCQTWGHLALPKFAFMREGYAAQFLTDESLMLDQGTTYYVSKPMKDVIAEAARHAEPDAIHMTDLPSPKGFMVLEQPLVFDDVDDEASPPVRRKVPIRAIGWYPSKVGTDRSDTALTRDEAYSDFDPFDHESRTVTPGIIFVLYSDRKSIEALGFDIDDDENVPRLAPTDLVPIQFGASWVGKEDRVPSLVLSTRKWLTAAFRLMWQELIDPSGVSTTRNMKKRAARYGWKLPLDGEVKVLKLRRIYRPDAPSRHGDDEKSWTLNYRTVTRPHWRNQWYPKLGEHRKIWIAAYIRGPEGAPLVLKHNVTSVVR